MAGIQDSPPSSLQPTDAGTTLSRSSSPSTSPASSLTEAAEPATGAGRTGDDDEAGFPWWAALLVAFAVALVGVVLFRRDKQAEERELSEYNRRMRAGEGSGANIPNAAFGLSLANSTAGEQAMPVAAAAEQDHAEAHIGAGDPDHSGMDRDGQRYVTCHQLVAAEGAYSEPDPMQLIAHAGSGAEADQASYGVPEDALAQYRALGTRSPPVSATAAYNPLGSRAAPHTYEVSDADTVFDAGSPTAVAATGHLLYQVVAAPNSQRDARRAKDGHDQGHVVQPNHAVVSQTSAGRIDAIPMASDYSNV